MDNQNSTPDAKYLKLAQEYSKLRAQANVLKKAVVEEQGKGGQLKESLRLKEVQLRRSEQEVDSLTFRNKQLELRVATLQTELEKNHGKQKRSLLNKSTNGNSITNNLTGVNNHSSSSTSASSATSASSNSDNVVAEEFQKKIIENAQLISLLADKSHELEMCQQTLMDLEEKVNSQLFKQSFAEEGLRLEIQELSMKNAELEMKLIESGRSLGGAQSMDEDNRSVATDNSSILADTAPVSCGTEDRIVALEKELSGIKAKYELLLMQEKAREEQQKQEAQPEQEGSNSESDGAKRIEDVLFEHFSRKMDEVLLEKQLAESKLVSYLTECDSLKDHLEILTDELRDQERQLTESQKAVRNVEDQLQTTRLNYEEQITVLTEQVLLLSDQLAAASN